jgi:hypothetical protein
MRSLAVVPLIPLVALLTLAGCSVIPSAASGSPSARPSPTRTDTVGGGASDPAAPPVSATAPAGQGQAAPADFPCNLYPMLAISDLTGWKVTKATPVTAVGDPTQRSCDYSTGDGVHEFWTEVATTNAAAHLQTWSLIENTGGPVSGVGDQAWGDDSELAAVIDGVYVEAGDQSDANDDSVALAHIGIAKLTLMVESLQAAALG